MNGMAEWLDKFLKTNGSDDLNLSNKMLRQYVCRSLTQENKGITDTNVVNQMIQNSAEDVGTLKDRETMGFIEAYKYMHELSQDENGGLLDHNVICDAHKFMMKTCQSWCTVGQYSTKDRIVEFEGKLHSYAKSHSIGNQMQMLIDEYNHKWSIIKDETRSKDKVKALGDLMHLLAWFVFTFLEIHPFSDGNGRLVRILYTYILEAYNFPFPVPLFWSTEQELQDSDKAYAVWCKLLWDTRITGELIQLEKYMIHVLKMCCNEYEIKENE